MRSDGAGPHQAHGRAHGLAREAATELVRFITYKQYWVDKSQDNVWKKCQHNAAAVVIEWIRTAVGAVEARAVAREVEAYLGCSHVEFARGIPALTCLEAAETLLRLSPETIHLVDWSSRSCRNMEN